MRKGTLRQVESGATANQRRVKMERPTEYQVVTGYDPITHRQTTESLAANVTRLLHEGWSPVGGVAAYVQDGLPSFVQAMVRYE